MASEGEKREVDIYHLHTTSSWGRVACRQKKSAAGFLFFEDRVHDLPTAPPRDISLGNSPRRWSFSSTLHGYVVHQARVCQLTVPKIHRPRQSGRNGVPPHPPQRFSRRSPRFFSFFLFVFGPFFACFFGVFSSSRVVSRRGQISGSF